MEPGDFRRLLGPLLTGRRWLIALDVAAAATPVAEFLKESGALRSFVLAGSSGTGTQPPPEAAEVALLGTSGTGIMDGIRAFHAALADLPDGIVARIDAWDPERRARVITAPFGAAGRIGGRATYGARPPAWEALEDKTRADEIWDGAGIGRATSAVVPVAAAAGAAARLDRGAGTVWAGDNRDGWHGGAERIRWVRSAEDAAEAAAFLAAGHDRVRVMPFLCGVPCSIHGMAFPDTVIAFRPVEILVFAVPGSGRLRYSGVASFWDPPPTDRAAMRRAARRVGVYLRERFGYRGGFTIDGVLTGDGFLPTELNARVGAGLATIARAVPDLPFGFVERALVAGDRLDYPPADLEHLIVTAADAVRRGGAHILVDRPVQATEKLGIVRDGSRYRPIRSDEAPEATLEFGPGPTGGFVRFVPEPDRTPRGASLAPAAAAAFACADDMWDTGIGPLEILPTGDP